VIVGIVDRINCHTGTRCGYSSLAGGAIRRSPHVAVACRRCVGPRRERPKSAQDLARRLARDHIGVAVDGNVRFVIDL